MIAGLLLCSLVGLLVAFGLLYGAVGPSLMGNDPDYYRQVAERIAAGELPYRDFALEYPPLSLVPMMVPLLAGGTGDAELYRGLLVVQNLAYLALSAWCLVWLANHGWAPGSAARTLGVFAVLVLASPVVLWRFDALPALLGLVGLVAYARGRMAWSGPALAAGVLVKLYPALLAVPLAAGALAERRPRAALALVAATAVPVAGVMLGLAAFAGPVGLSFLGYAAGRGVQLESLPASIALLIGLAGGPAARAFEGFGAWQLDSPVADLVAPAWGVVSLLLGGVLLASMVARFRADVADGGGVRPPTLVAHMLATLLLAMLAYRVLSPQYIAWLIPLAALLPLRGALLALAICQLTLIVYPLSYWLLPSLAPALVLPLIVRNGLLLVLYGWLIWPGLRLALTQLRAFAGRSLTAPSG